MPLTEEKIQFSGGIEPLDLVAQYGAPLYVYDTAVMEKQFLRLKSAFRVKHLQLNYACKALTNIAVLQYFRQLGAGLDTVSIFEVRLGLHAGYQAGEITFTPSGVSFAEVAEAVALGVKINIDNLSLLEHFGQQYPQIPVCIRVNPHIMAGGNLKTSVGHIDSKFGISVHQLPLVHRIVANTGLTVNGLHMHSGSDILDPSAFLAGAEILLNAARDFPDLTYLDLGSGFKVPYKPNDLETNIEELGELLSLRFNDFCREYGRQLTLMFEPGKFLVSAAGYFLARVNVIKQTTSTVFAGVDTGFNHLIRPMFYQSYHHITNVSRPQGKPRFYNVVGYICETDTFASNRPIAEIHEGDVLAFHNAGAYCFSMASNYNSRLRPAEVLIWQGQAHLIRERESFEDLLRGQHLLPALAVQPAKAEGNARKG